MQRKLTIGQTQQGIEDSKERLELFQHNKFEFLRRSVTRALSFHTKSVEWAARDKQAPKCAKTQKPFGRVLATPIGHSETPMIFIDYHKKGKTINNDY